MGNKSLSVIIPMYNAEPFIERCLKSVMEIQEADLEIIVVNDGSTDAGEEIVKKYEAFDSRIILISDRNHGVSHARNIGIKKATGEWIAFVDADDVIVSNVYVRALQCVDDTSELISFKNLDMDFYDKNKELSYEIFQVENDELDIVKSGVIFTDYEPAMKYKRDNWVFRSPCGKLYKREVIEKNSIYFEEEVKIGEDALFNYMYLALIEKLTCLNAEGYLSYQNPHSAMHKYTEGKGELCLNSIKYFKQVAPDKELEVAQYGIRGYLYALKLDYCHLKNPKSYRERKADAFNARNSEIVTACFNTARICDMRRAARILAVCAKYRLFFVCDVMLKIKEKLSVRFSI